MGVSVKTLGPDEWEAWSSRVAALEDGIDYPLGDDRFSIDHGANYFAFFRRLGELRYDVVLDGDRVVAVCARVLREVPIRCWYICDLKVHKDYRGQRIPTKLAAHSFIGSYATCRRGYAISMNPVVGENSVVRLVNRLPIVPVRVPATLVFFSLSREEMQRASPLVQEHRGALGYRSLSGTKDILLKSTGRPMNLHHVQFGTAADIQHQEPQAGAVHMFCSPESDPLAQNMLAQGFDPSATASVVSHGMAKTNFNFVLTSEI